jgi:probable DNA repair protein
MSSLNRGFIAHLASGGTVLTATRRQSRLIRSLYDRAQLAAGRQAWPTAGVMPLAAWTAARWREACQRDDSLPALLDDAQALWPWRRVADDFLDPSLVDTLDLSRAARRSWAELRRHGGSLARLEPLARTRDQHQFHAWARRVEAELGARGWLDPGQLEEALSGCVHLLERTSGLLLAGFTRRPRTLEDLVGRLGSAGWPIDVAPAAGDPGLARVHAATDPAAEVVAIATWARHRLEANPRARLAVVLADLQGRRGMLERRLAEALQPELELPGTLEHDCVFDFAGGPALAGFGVAEAALDCLDAVVGPVRFGTVSRLLRSPYAGDPREQEARTRFEVVLRERGLLEWPQAALVARARAAGCTGFAKALESAGQALRQDPGPRGTDGWAQAFGGALAAWGWPGTATLASDEYQMAQALRDRLRDFAALARTAPRMRAAEALREFSRVVAGPFQPERGEAAIWLYDSLEPPGVGFDGLWVAGMTAAAWPSAAAQDPFIPVSLQEELGMPGATAADALAEARATTEAWRASAPEVVFSWPLRQDDAAVEPSRVLPRGLQPLDPLAAVATRTGLLLAAGGASVLAEDPAPPLAGAARGGARVLELQARCPFRAFAELRLAARPLEEPAAGVDRRRRGMILHRALELAWGRLRSQAALDALSPQALRELLDESLAVALAEELPAELGPEARVLERDWQYAALMQLMEIERGRAPFEVVDTEAELREVFAGLPLTLRVDRVDRVEQGLVILDYKTGRAATSQWRGARPDAPQLPLYAVLKGAQVAGVAIAAAGAHAARFHGVGAAAGIMPGLQEAEKFKLTEDGQRGFSWEVVRARWAGWLADLARDHLGGVATVDPKQPQTCRHCHLPTLCRVAAEPDPHETEAGDE